MIIFQPNNFEHKPSVPKLYNFLNELSNDKILSTHKSSGRLGLQGSDGDGLVQGVAGHNLPVVEH